jgi:hypothetical protein
MSAGEPLELDDVLADDGDAGPSRASSAER